MRRSFERALAIIALSLAGCVEMPPDYMAARPSDAADREMQGRRFDGIEEKQLLDAAVGVLQDLGFTVDITSVELGFVQGAKDRDAKAPGQVLVATIIAVLMHAPPTMREDQTISVLLSVRPVRQSEPRSHIVLVTFHRHLRQPLQHTAGPLREPQLYQSFFELLSKALFLEAHRL